MLIDETFFTGELHIDGLIDTAGVSSATTEAIKAELISLCNLYESRFYRESLGEVAAKEFVQYLNTEGANPVEKWENLKSMLVEKIGNDVYSPVAYYIYFFYLRKNQVQSTPLGTMSEESSKVVPCNIKMINSWNQMVYMNTYLARWLYEHKNDYGGYYFDDSLLESINAFGI